MTPEPQQPPMLELRALCVSRGGQEILHQLSLSVGRGELVTLLGPSGCGKSTLLKTVAGLLTADCGDIRIGGSSVLSLPTEKRGAVIVFQDLRLFPHLSVAGNIEFPLRLLGISRSRRAEEVRRLLDIVHLPGLEYRRVSQLSGGQMQRVALARALAAQPRLLLLDEPFSNLDEELRREMDDFVQELHRQSDITIVMVTHDKREALSISDRIALMMNGRLVQMDVPEEIYRRPATRQISDYWGNCSYLAGQVKAPFFYHPALPAPVPTPCCKDGRWTARIPLSGLRLLEQGPWEVIQSRYQGESSLVTLRLGDSTLTARTDAPIPAGVLRGVALEPDELILFPEENNV